MIGQTTQIINPIPVGAISGNYKVNMNFPVGNTDVVHNLGTEDIMVDFFKVHDSISLDYKRKAGSTTTTITVSVIGAPQNNVDVHIIGLS